jgi:hypothetical protein
LFLRSLAVDRGDEKMLKTFHENRKAQLVLGFLMGVVFGFLLQKGGVTRYDVIIGQLLLRDFTVIKVMLTAMVVGKIGVHFLKSAGMAELHPKPGSLGSVVVGGLIFGVGFGLLGYCPGTVAGAVGQGSLDGLFGGVVGILVGAGFFSEMYPMLEGTILGKGDFGDLTWPQLFKRNHWWVVVPVALGVIGMLFWLEKAGL